MRPGTKKALLLAVVVLLLGVLLYRSSGALRIGQFSGAKLWQALREADPRFLALSLLLIYGCYAVRSLRWQVFQRNIGPADFWGIYSMTLAGFSAVFLLGRAGEPARPFLLAKRAKVSVANMFGIWVLERIFDVASMAAIAAIALLVFRSGDHVGEAAAAVQKAAKTSGVLLSVGVIAAAAMLVYLRLHGTAVLERKFEGWIAIGGWRAKVAKIFLGFIFGIQTVRSLSDLLLATLYSALHWFMVLIVYFSVCKGFGGRLSELTLGECMLLLSFTLLGSAVQLPAVGGGAQALAIFAFTKVLGVDSEPAVAATIVLWLVTFASCSLVGIPLLIKEGFSVGKLREIAEHEKEELDEIVVSGLHGSAGKGETPE